MEAIKSGSVPNEPDTAISFRAPLHTIPGIRADAFRAEKSCCSSDKINVRCR